MWRLRIIQTLKKVGGARSCIQQLPRILYLGGLHALELLLKLVEHLLGDLKLYGAWVLLDGEGILAQVLDEHLLFFLVVLPTHVDHHVLLVLAHWCGSENDGTIR